MNQVVKYILIYHAWNHASDLPLSTSQPAPKLNEDLQDWEVFCHVGWAYQAWRSDKAELTDKSQEGASLEKLLFTRSYHFNHIEEPSAFGRV